MLHRKRLGLFSATAALALMTAAQVFAQSPVVATVGEEEITEADLTAAQAEIGGDFERVPEDQRRIAVLAALIDIKVLAQAAEEATLQDDAQIAATIDFLRDRTLHNAYFAREGVDTVTDEELRARYEQEIAAMEPPQEVRARHILLETEDQARTVIEELQNGADFAELATEKSTGPTAQNGGDLGFFADGQMVPPFSEAAFALEPGAITEEPVQTQFGWHVIKVEEKRQAEPPAYEQVQEQIRRAVLQEKYVGLVGEAREELGVTYVDPAVKQQMDDLKAKADAAAAEMRGGSSN
ncbi:PpiC-type peptidyl-prolyl cis-trans isomerase [Fulvimarina pelagi HTCC2506]|uniref:Parvulin-like PPIase n=1 Tax=Fulvimarina pelagi HTCC2506 TaxID=314231 RepID=Q0G7Z9_9HYPH|nr:peptidylprolyl isomerase [Fulvimarina pelagi]EAU42215.1 PpiC-type peptidyl-prolyl cis-trans isomerase [Fulvimarina pelagi HTCC2506]